MLTLERQQRILRRLESEGKVLSSELSAALGVSEDTVRRDLKELADAGLLKRVHGGALPRSVNPLAYAERQEHRPAAKEAIAAVAAGLIRTGQIVIMDGGTTVAQVARRLPADLRVTVVTHSLGVAQALCAHSGVELILVGGKVLKESLVAVGAEAVQSYQQIRADVCLLGVCSLHREFGLTTPLYEEVLVKKTIVANSAEVVALLSADKLETMTPYRVGAAEDLTHLVTEAGVSDEVLAPYRQAGLTILRADAPDPAAGGGAGADGRAARTVTR